MAIEPVFLEQENGSITIPEDMVATNIAANIRQTSPSERYYYIGIEDTIESIEENIADVYINDNGMATINSGKTILRGGDIVSLEGDADLSEYFKIVIEGYKIV